MSRLKQIEAFLLEDPDDSFLLFALASEYRKAGNLVEAQKQFEKLKRIDPDYVGLYYHLGKIIEQIGSLAAAQEVYREGIECASKLQDFHARSELQSALLESEAWDE